jgi:hypothetical protein
MLNRLHCALAASIILVTPSIVTANPITYDFSGTFDTPINGTDQFSGSFTIDVNPTATYYSSPAYPTVSPWSVSENGTDVSLTVTIGGQTTNYVNTPGSFNLASLWVGQNPSNYELDPSGDVIRVAGSPAYSDPGINPGFGLVLNNPTDVIFSQMGPNNVVNLQNFDFSALNVGMASYTNESGVLDDGTITSVEAVPAPEPSTLAVFAMLGIAAIVHRRRRNTSRDRIAR